MAIDRDAYGVHIDGNVARDEALTQNEFDALAWDDEFEPDEDDYYEFEDAFDIELGFDPYAGTYVDEYEPYDDFESDLWNEY